MNVAAGSRHAPSRATKRIVGLAVAMLLAWLLAAWVWERPFMAKVRASWELSRMAPPDTLPVPVQGVRASRIADTFGAPRGNGRSHAGVDIFAKRGTPVVSATRGIVAAVRDGGLGGRQVWIIGPARERHYYAHLEDWQAGLEAGDLVGPGDPLGTVGTSGNARGTPPHLHYGIYGGEGAYDPLPLFRAHPR